MKKFIITLSLFICIAASIIFVYVKENNNYLAETALTQSFSDLGAKVVSSEIYFWGKVNDPYIGLDKLDKLTQEIISSLGVIEKDSFSRKSFENDLICKIETKGKTDNNRIVNITVQQSKNKGHKEDSFISANITQDHSYEGLTEVRQKVQKIFKKYDIEPKVNSCITGCFDGKRNDNELNDISTRMFKQTQAKNIEGIRDRNLISVSAYSPYIDDYIEVNGKRVNLNLAIRYNSYEDKTYIWLATPVITIEY